MALKDLRVSCFFYVMAFYNHKINIRHRNISTYLPTEQSLKQSMKQSKEQSIEQSTKKITTDQIAEKSTEKIPEQSTEQISEQSTEQSEVKTLKLTEPICPSDWHLLNKVCYYFGFENLDFVTASNKCKSKGAILYEAKDQISYDQVFELAKTISRGYQSDNYVYFWIGITDMANENDYRYYSDNSKGNCFKFVNCFLKFRMLYRSFKPFSCMDKLGTK